MCVCLCVFLLVWQHRWLQKFAIRIFTRCCYHAAETRTAKDGTNFSAISIFGTNFSEILKTSTFYSAFYLTFFLLARANAIGRGHSAKSWFFLEVQGFSHCTLFLGIPLYHFSKLPRSLSSKIPIALPRSL